MALSVCVVAAIYACIVQAYVENLKASGHCEGAVLAGTDGT
eukprot:SAG25_NODE_4729_length_760_cov_0.620272_1_plen_40_part_10